MIYSALDFVHDANAWQLIDDEYNVFSPMLDRWFTASTLTIARHNRSEAERVSREHHAKNEDN